MLKFIKFHMSSIADIEIYPLISFLIFFSIFILAVVQAFFFLKKKDIQEVSALPLEEDHDVIL